MPAYRLHYFPESGNSYKLALMRPTVADFSMMAYLHYPADETGYDFATSHPAVHAWLGRIATLPGWKSAYDLLPGKRLTHYVREADGISA
jgi:glutathione S-transferase